MFKNIYIEMAANNRMTQKQLAKLLGISEKSMTNKIYGRTEFTLSEIKKICSLFGKTLEYLFATDQDRSA